MVQTQCLLHWEGGARYGNRLAASSETPDVNQTQTLLQRFLHCCLAVSQSINNMAENEHESLGDWERAEGVPALTDPFIQKYLSGRDALVQQEKKQRSGR